MNARPILAAGGLLVLLGLVGVLAPGVVAGWSLSTTAIVLVGIGATVFVLRAARQRYRTDAEYVDLPRSGDPPEEAYEPAAFGARVADDVAAAVPTRHFDQRETLKRRLREDVTRALVARGESQNAAKRAVRDGTWTDDDLAAAFLSERVDLPARESIRLSLARDSVDRQVAHVAAELDGLTEVA